MRIFKFWKWYPLAFYHETQYYKQLFCWIIYIILSCFISWNNIIMLDDCINQNLRIIFNLFTNFIWTIESLLSVPNAAKNSFADLFFSLHQVYDPWEKKRILYFQEKVTTKKGGGWVSYCRVYYFISDKTITTQVLPNYTEGKILMNLFTSQRVKELIEK